MKILAVIPARYRSKRFPGKVLANILGKPMLQWVWEAVQRSNRVDEVGIATDDQRVAEAAMAFGARVFKTSPDHPSGSDRVAEVAKRAQVGLVLNVQSDEPLLKPELIDELIDALEKDSRADISTPVFQVDRAEAESQDVVKAVVDPQGRALYFSRALIPCPARHETKFLRHIGVYAFRKYALLNFSKHGPSTLERIEGLEQLRALEMGMTVKAVQVKHRPVSVDRPQDIPKVEAIMRQEGF